MNRTHRTPDHGDDGHARPDLTGLSPALQPLGELVVTLVEELGWPAVRDVFRREIERRDNDELRALIDVLDAELGDDSAAGGVR